MELTYSDWLQVKTWTDNVTASLARIEAKIDAMATQERIDMAALDDEITKLTGQVAADTTAENSALTLINGFSAQLAAAIAAAAAAGASPGQLASLDALGTTISDNAASLAAAVAANTPPPPPPPPPAA